MASARDQSLSINMVMNSAINGANFLQVSVNKVHTFAKKVEKIDLLGATKFPLLNRNIKQLDNHLGRIRSQTAKISANPIRLDIKTSRDSLKEARKDMTAIEHDAKQVAFWTKKSADNLRVGTTTARTKTTNKKPTDTSVMMGAVATASMMVLPFKASIDFESNMADVKALTKNITAEDFTLLTAKARELGASTEWSASQSALGMTYLAKAGFDTKQQLGAMNGVLGLATAGSVDLAVASDIGSNILSGFNIQAEKMGTVSDILAKTFSTSNTDLMMLGDTMKYTAPIAAGLGVGLSEVSALAGKLGDVGIQGSMAGTSLRQMYTRLSAPPSEARKALEALGISVFDAKGKFKGMPNIIGELNVAMDGMSDESKAMKLKHLFGMEALSSGVALMKVGKQGLLDYKATLDNSSGTTKNIQDIKLESTKGHFKLLMSAVEGLSISATTNLLPAIKSVSNVFKTGAEKLDMFTQKFPNASKWIIGLGAAFVIGSVALAGFGLIASGVGAGLALLTAPVTLVVLGLAAIGAGAIFLYNKFDFVKNSIDGFFGGFMSGISPLLSEFKGLFGGLGTAIGGLFTSLSPVFSAIGSILNAVGINFENIGSVMSGAISMVLFPIKMLIKALTWVVGIGSMVVDGWVSIGTLAVDIWNGITTAIKSPFITLFDWIDEKFKTVMGVVDKVKDMASTVTNVGSDIKNKVSEKTSNLWDGTKSFFGFGDEKKPKVLKAEPANNMNYKKVSKVEENFKKITNVEKIKTEPTHNSSLKEIPKLPIESVSAVTDKQINEQKTQIATNQKPLTQNINNQITVQAVDGKIDYEDLKEKLKRAQKELAHDELDTQIRDVS